MLIRLQNICTYPKAYMPKKSSPNLLVSKTKCSRHATNILVSLISKWLTNKVGVV